MNRDPREDLREITNELRLQLEEWSDLDAGENFFHAPDLPGGAASPAISASVPPRSESAQKSAPSTRTPERPASIAASVAPLVQAAPRAQVAPPSVAPARADADATGSTARPLEVIREEVRGCTKCELSKTRTNTVFSRGSPDAKLCFIGEAPGADEDAEGVPFVGRAGQLLDKMIGAMGLDPEKDVYVCNIIKCRPPENRRPTPEETATCFPYLHEQLASAAPQVIVALGNTAVQGLLETKLGITKVRGQWKLYRGRIPVMPTYHPSYLLRPSAQQASAKREAWEDLQAVMKELGLSLPTKGKGNG